MRTDEQKRMWASRIVKNCAHRWHLREDGRECNEQAHAIALEIAKAQEFLTELTNQEDAQKAVYEKSCTVRGAVNSSMEQYELHQLSIMKLGFQSHLTASMLTKSALEAKSLRSYEGAMRYVDRLEDFFIIGDIELFTPPDWYEAIDTQQALLDDAEARLRQVDTLAVPKWDETRLQLRHYIDLERAVRHGEKEEAVAAMMLYESIMTALQSKTNFDDRQDVYMRMEAYGEAINYSHWAVQRLLTEQRSAK
jgi:hypothetical protein